jgi:hypothetical protein
MIMARKCMDVLRIHALLPTEFQKICSNYGITRGSYTLKQYRDMNYKVTQFVNRCYTQALGRKGEADNGGLKYWVGLLNKGTSRQKVNDSMAGSKEFTEIVKSYGL